MNAKKKSIAILLAVLVVLSAVMLTACVTTEDNVITVLAPDGAPAFAIAKLLNDQPQIDGYKVEYKVVKADQIADKMSNGEGDIAILPTNLGANLYNKGQPIKYVGTTTFGQMYILSKDQTVTKLADLQGKTVVSIGQASIPEFVLRYILQQNNIEATLEFRTDGTGIIQGLAAAEGSVNSVTIGSLAEPAVTQAVTKTGAAIVIDLQEEWAKLFPDQAQSGYAQSGLFATDDVIANHGELLSVITASIAACKDWIEGNVTAANDAVVAAGGVTTLASAEVAKRCNFGFLSAADGKDFTDAFYQILYDADAKLIGGKIPNAAFYAQ